MTYQPTIRRTRILAACCSILLATQISPTRAAAQEHNHSTDAINHLNVLFRMEYSEARQSHLRKAGPIILVRGDFLLLLEGEKRTQGSTVHPNYHDLKAISHGPLALFCILESCLDQPLTEDHKAKLNALTESLTAVSNDLESTFEDAGQRNRQAKLITHCLDFIRAIIAAGTCRSTDLDDVVDGLRPDIVSNASEAARIRIDNYHAQMQRWRKELDDDAWRSLYVVIPGATLPRQNSLAVAYFAKLFEQAGEGNRVIYAEAQFDEAQDLQLLGTHLLDSSIGKAFFDDASRMKRDLLGPFATAYLDALDFETFREPTGTPRVDDSR